MRPARRRQAGNGDRRIAGKARACGSGHPSRQSAQMDGRDAVSLQAAADAEGLRRRGARSDPANVGFRKVEIRGGRFLVNGQAGADQRRQPPRAQRDTAKYVPVESMIKDIRIMKQFNVNAVRTSPLSEFDRPGTTSATATASTCSTKQTSNATTTATTAQSPDQRSGVAARLSRPRGAHGGARQESPVGRDLVDGQRIRRRPQCRGGLSVDEEARSVAAVPLRGHHRHGGSNADINSFMYPTPERGEAGTPPNGPICRSSSANTRTPWATAAAV